MARQGDAFPGLLNLVYMYLDTLDVEPDERERLEAYLDLIRRRTNGASSSFLSLRALSSSGATELTVHGTRQASSGQRRAGSGSSCALTRSTSLTRSCRRRSTTTSWLLLTRCECSGICTPFYTWMSVYARVLMYHPPYCRERGQRAAPDFLPENYQSQPLKV